MSVWIFSQSAASRSGLVTAITEGFAENLLQKGYSRSIAYRHFRAAIHLTEWAKAQSVPVVELNQNCLPAFRDHLPSCTCFGPYHDKAHSMTGARLFLLHLLDLARPDTRVPNHEGPESSLISDFTHFMREHRGITESTLATYVPQIIALVKECGDDPCQFEIDQLRAFALNRAGRPGTSRGRNVITAIRSFLRFLVATGRCPIGWDAAAIPQIVVRRLARLPQYLSSSQIDAMLATCDANTLAGLRNRAILLLCARLGLRASDIIALKLTDIDWTEASVKLTGKGRRESRLPLTQELGDAVLAYIERGRGSVERGHLFLTAYAPWRPLSRSSTVSSIVARAMQQAGIDIPGRGAAHLLRHSAATEMLKQGSSLYEIANVLRHRSIDTTAHYAKVDQNLLRTIAQPWPGDSHVAA